ncbi:MAG: hypothetical protein FJ078_00555 [Cyanobacteria bacterium K_DeepCast_35m_m2_155]|nr:hypothetical protein [Cyanobacteria bacterium K_DeepCast_35m_m2_155]
MPTRQSAGSTLLWAVPALLVLLSAVALTALSTPPPGRASRPRSALPAAAVPPGSSPAAAGTLLQRLATADLQWRPRSEPLPNGGTRYVYRKRPGEPDLSLAEIKALMANPPRFEAERAAISDLWAQLQRLGVRLKLEQPRKSGAAGEWDPAARTLRIKPAVVDKGSAEFARVLNHEAIHVAQSCSGGGISATPRPLGLPQQLPARLQSVLQQPTYARADARERLLEREAYANQEELQLGLTLLRIHC